jgi:parallel beta-helix repeat protein
VVVAWGDNNRIVGNSIYGNPGGVLVYNRSTGTEVSNNTIHNNSPLAGLLIQGANATVVRSNSIYDNAENVVNEGQGTQGLAP